MEGELVADFVKKQIKIQDTLQNRIRELEEELNKANDGNDDYALYRQILRYIIPNVHFSYSMTNENGSYEMTLDPPVSMPLELMNQLIEDIKKYKENNIGDHGEIW